ncbi:MAG: hypothetical protein AAF802_03230 [Planctomycetota bacterium]
MGKRPLGKKNVSSIAVVVLLAIYAFLQPKLNEQFGWNLPGLHDSDSPTEVADRSGDSVDDPSLVGVSSKQDREAVPSEPADTRKATDSKATNSQSRGAENTKTANTKSESGRANSDRGPPAEIGDAKKTDGQTKLRYGMLRHLGGERYMSPEGLLYGPGSEEGHRIEHVRRHVEDIPSRSGKHGVFDGGIEKTLQTIDQAYKRAKNNQRTTKRSDGSLTIYTVDMGRRVGYVGGREGNRKRKPMARRVRLVLNGNKVITAYPM